jgi:hypothetical protein
MTITANRPLVNSMSQHRINEFARLNNITPNRATDALLEAGWQAAIERLETKARHYVPPTESDERVTVAYHMPKSIVDEVRKIAVAERRSASGTAAELIRAGLRARAAASAKAPA